MSKILYHRENLLKSIISDTYTIGTLLIAVMIIIVLFFAGLASGNATKKFYSYDDLIKYLEKEKAQHQGGRGEIHQPEINEDGE